MAARSPILLLALSALVLLIPVGAARADTEPANDTLLGAEGPLKAGVKYSGKVGGSVDEEDWYFLHIQPQVEVTITHGSDCLSYYLSLMGRNGASYDDEGGLVSSSSNTLTYTTPPGGPRLYYLKAYCESSSIPYSFTVTTKPSNGVIPGPNQFGPPIGVGEPNEFVTQAIGPLAGGVTYQGVTGTSNDADWFYFYGKPQRELEISTTTASCDEGGSLYFYTDESGSSWQHSTRINRNEVSRITYTTDTTLRKYHIKADCGQSDYLFKIEPASAVASEACVAAIAARNAVAAWSRSEQRKLRRARRKHVTLMRKLKRRIKQGRRAGAAKRTKRRAKRQHRKRIKKLKSGATTAKRALSDHRGAAQLACA